MGDRCDIFVYSLYVPELKVRVTRHADHVTAKDYANSKAKRFNYITQDVQHYKKGWPRSTVAFGRPGALETEMIVSFGLCRGRLLHNLRLALSLAQNTSVERVNNIDFLIIGD